MVWRNITLWVLSLAGITVGAAIVIVAISTFGDSYRTDALTDVNASPGRPGAATTPVSPGGLPPGSRLVIPSIEVDAGMIVVGVDAAGAMQTPTNGREVGWYDFSAPPGQAGNTVISGHVDYYDIGPAVLWRLRELSPGDEVRIQLGDGGGVVSYQVSQVESYEAGTAPVDAIIGDTEGDVLTLITCDGWFDASVREYDHRLVVRAERVS